MEKQLDLQDAAALLENAGLMDVYKKYTDMKDFSLYFERPDSIHGVLHASRVLMLNLILSHYNSLSSDDTEILIKASMYHDIGRTHDGICYEHGRLSFKKMLELGLIEDERSEETEILRYVMENHCIHDEEALANIKNYHINDRERGINLLKIFKDCDNLDRVRINDLDPNYLRNPVSRKMVQLAHQLFAEIR